MKAEMMPHPLFSSLNHNGHACCSFQTDRVNRTVRRPPLERTIDAHEA